MRPDLASCYGQERLPRYTSYPTAPHFSDTIGPETYAEWLKAIPRHASASLYLHVPFCRSMCWYCGCHTTVARRDEPISVYAAALRCELNLVSRWIERRINVDHIHFGGGTPTIMAPELFVDLIGAIRHSFIVLPSAEIAVEIDPRTLTGRMVDALGLAGVNRASLGVQSFDPLVQRTINREQSFEETARGRLRRASRRIEAASQPGGLGPGLIKLASKFGLTPYHQPLTACRRAAKLGDYYRFAGNSGQSPDLCRLDPVANGSSQTLAAPGIARAGLLQLTRTGPVTAVRTARWVNKKITFDLNQSGDPTFLSAE